MKAGTKKTVGMALKALAVLLFYDQVVAPTAERVKRKAKGGA